MYRYGANEKEKALQSFELQGLIWYFRTQSRDRTGMEVNPLVFETSASTNSAIWAFALFQMRGKGMDFF